MSSVSQALVSFIDAIFALNSEGELDRDLVASEIVKAFSPTPKKTPAKKTVKKQARMEEDEDLETSEEQPKKAKKTAKPVKKPQVDDEELENSEEPKKAAKKPVAKKTVKSSPLPKKTGKVPSITTEPVGDYDRVHAKSRLVFDDNNTVIGQLADDDATLEPLSAKNVDFCEANSFKVNAPAPKKASPKKVLSNPKAKALPKKSGKDDVVEEPEGEIEEDEEESQEVEEDEE